MGDGKREGVEENKKRWVIIISAMGPTVFDRHQTDRHRQRYR